MAKYLPFSAQIQIAMQATAAATQKKIVDTAKREHNKVMRADPRPQIFSREVDGRLGAPEESVRPHGVIHYRYPRLESVVQFAMEELFRRSPVDSGLYRESHTIFLNGTAVSSLRAWKLGDDVAIGNPLPYARKIEVGAMTMKKNDTDHVYENTFRAVQRRYKDLVTVRFTFRGIAGGTGRGANRVDRDTRQPVLLFKEL